MKAKVLLAVAIVAAAAAVVGVLRLRASSGMKGAAGAESRGDYAAALTQYAGALCRAIPDRALPDVNRSRIFAPAAWKKTVAEYAAWLSGATAAPAGDAGQDTLLEAVRRNAARLHADNFMSGDSVKKLAPEQYKPLWNSAFFAPGVTPDSGHCPLADSCFAGNLSFIRASALTSFTYEVSLIDTAAGRRTTFSVYPESSTLVLAPPGAHFLLCTSSFQPGPGMIWRSTPSLIPVTVPSSPSLCSFTLGTHVVRGEKKN
jgi:hypothetical protein